MNMMEHLLGAVLELTREMVYSQEDSKGQMATHTAMVGLQAGKMVQEEVHIAMRQLQDIRELVDVMWQSVAVQNKWSSGYTVLQQYKSLSTAESYGGSP